MYDVIIVGGGPAGGSAAIYTSKAGKKTLVLDNDKGVTRRAMLYNHYGVESITGPDLIETGKKQAEKYGAEWVNETAAVIESAGGVHTLKTAEGNTYEAKHVILATGYSIDLAEASGLEVVPGTEPRVKNIIDVDAKGKTSKAGIWAAGTAAGVSVHTIITAGDGAKVAINVISEMNGERYVDHDVLK
ncbi:pyridine nucleotide-disulphide oxidoreductase [Bacillus oleivorans]|uniref:Pyridine nucleotide-disulphide oxidoreductase n=1 Tax=Bacillus oleivorans TaxID=1448271 RepID=A0A285CNU4_9BACI|nr:FAD-dependent oxidoreductase [Bacillus oleivorans]SNX68653.1 pyridine nucleotide-disulphide oxidoreductase [Bacillus oleivorans]